MVERKVCQFCGEEIEPGTGMMYVRRDATIYHFCSSKCKRNLLKLKRVPQRARWTARYSRKRK